MIDCHVHLLPGIDDGARNLEEAIEMAGIAVEDGIHAVIATPHHLNGVYHNEAGRILQAVEDFRKALAERGIPLEVYPGSEVHLTPELPDALAISKAMTLAGKGKAVLVEPPVHHVPVGAESILESCLHQGLVPVIAHPERNAVLKERLDLLERWVDMGCRIQITAQSCTGKFGPRIQEASRRMVQKGLVHIVASDGHRPYARVPRLSGGREVVAQWTNEEVAKLLTDTYPRALIEGKAVDISLLHQTLGQRPPRRRWRFWRQRGLDSLKDSA